VDRVPGAVERLRQAGRLHASRTVALAVEPGRTVLAAVATITSEVEPRAALDASCLLLPLVRFLPPDDERSVRTVHAIADELGEDGLVLRYCTEETDDGLLGEEGAFVICSFWLVSALVELGEVARARGLCEKLLCYASGLQLYAEEIDTRSGRQLGNFPQAFSHLALINALMHVIRADAELIRQHPRVATVA
jgi:GH15 family glucan-1,4-alpha-glucosidase